MKITFKKHKKYCFLCAFAFLRLKRVRSPVESAIKVFYEIGDKSCHPSLIDFRLLDKFLKNKV
jgi:hypothetical protein